MKNLHRTAGNFRVMETADGVQTAVMRLKNGETSGRYGNEHPASTQMLYVVSGEVDAEIGNKKSRLRQGDCVIVSRGESHRFTGASQEPAVTLNIYTPPAY